MCCIGYRIAITPGIPSLCKAPLINLVAVVFVIIVIPIRRLLLSLCVLLARTILHRPCAHPQRLPLLLESLDSLLQTFHDLEFLHQPRLLFRLLVLNLSIPALLALSICLCCKLSRRHWSGGDGCRRVVCGLGWRVLMG